jgi:hypothetical protein
VGASGAEITQLLEEKAMAKHPRHPSDDTGASDNMVTVKLHVFHEKHSEGECKSHGIPDATVYVYDECGDTPPLQTSGAANADGMIELSLPHGVYRLVPKLPPTYVGRLYTRLAGGFLVEVNQESHCTIPIECHTRPASLKASACLYEGAPTPGSAAPASVPVENPAYLPNVTFRLHRGVGVGSKVHHTITPKASPWEACFDNLEPGFYTLVADLPSDVHYQARSQRKTESGAVADTPSDANHQMCCTTQVVHLCEGQTVDLGCCLCVEAITSEVTATVSDECGNPVPDAPLLLVGPQGRYPATTKKGRTYTFSSIPVGTYQLRLAGSNYLGNDGARWQPAMESIAVQVGPTPNTVPVDFVVKQDIQRISFKIVDSQGHRNRFAVIGIYNANKNLIDTVVVDGEGNGEWTARPPHANFYIAPLPNTGEPPAHLYPVNGPSPS